MKNIKSRRLVAILASASLFSITTASAQAAAPIYMEAVATSATLTPIVSAGDMIGTYLVPGIPDGLGVMESGKNLKIITNHEWSATNAVAAGRTTAGGLVSRSSIWCGR